MAIQTTKWTPDTHDCVIEYEWDDSVPESERVHTFKRFIKEPTHTRFIGTGKEKFEKIFEENQRKNKAIFAVLEALPDTEIAKIADPNGNDQKWFKPGKEPKWSFDDDGNVQIETVHTGTIKKSISDKLEEKFGIKVKLKQNDKS